MEKYWLVEVIENDCIVTPVGVYNEILPEPSGTPSGSVLGTSLGLRRYFTPPLVTIQLQSDCQSYLCLGPAPGPPCRAPASRCLEGPE